MVGGLVSLRGLFEFGGCFLSFFFFLLFSFFFSLHSLLSMGSFLGFVGCYVKGWRTVSCEVCFCLSSSSPALRLRVGKTDWMDRAFSG